MSTENFDLRPSEISILQTAANLGTTSSREIAAFPFIDPKTVSNEFDAIRLKLDVHRRFAAVMKALRLGIVHLPADDDDGVSV